MRWDNTVALYLMLAFGVFITLRGELPLYMGFILAKGAQPVPTASVAPVGTQTSQQSSAASTAKTGIVGGLIGIGKALIGL